MAKKQLIADLHIHGKYSRGCSKNITIKTLEKYARLKGIDILGTGDFTHPKWISELKNNLIEDGSGFLKTKSGFKFTLSTEISLIYTQDGKGRRIHICVLAPSFKIADEITNELKKHGRVDYDGRPIFKIPADEFVKILKNISEDIEIFPAHIWTPYFSMFGEYNQFSTIEECFKDQSKHIYAIEMGLSSDPVMNGRIKNLENVNFLAFSDAHSYWPWRLGREATVFNIEENYQSLISAIRTGKGIVKTLIVNPSYGKYHFDGHRKCGVCLSPKKSIAQKRLCPVCGKPLTIGVATRVEELSNINEKKITRQDFLYMIPLSEIIAARIGKNVNTKSVSSIYNKLIEEFNNEYNILLNVSYSELLKVTDENIAKLIIKSREQKLKISPGYDGEYGKIQIN